MVVSTTHITGRVCWLSGMPHSDGQGVQSEFEAQAKPATSAVPRDAVVVGRDIYTPAEKKTTKKEHYNLILGCNLIDRLTDPTSWVQQSVEQMAPNDGVLVIASPYTWKREHADPEVWIGGKYVEGQPCRT